MAGNATQAGPMPADATALEIAMPPEPRAALERAYAGARVVLEYGSGGSTCLAAELGADQVLAVESDRTWAERVSQALAGRFPGRDARVHHVDIGPTGSWGTPVNAAGFRRYHRYPTEVWDLPDLRHPDVVLIDGRFRAACFVTTVLRCTAPVTVLFDDYAPRTHYHWVEALVPVAERHGRMALFRVEPRALPPALLGRLAAAFADQR
jgi:hypothetical protein